ncbi:MAG: hypothetical protein JSW73_01315 [Candidatus Woesearchaeota archaeon]|nr:MAG: hypothetical protein JSW73_01315 [Candidatus Woesearchaeota archaeon]
MGLKEESRTVKEMIRVLFKDLVTENKLENVLMLGRTKGKWTLIDTTNEDMVSRMVNEHGDELQYNDTCYIVDVDNPNKFLKYKKN